MAIWANFSEQSKQAVFAREQQDVADTLSTHALTNTILKAQLVLQTGTQRAHIQNTRARCRRRRHNPPKKAAAKVAETQPDGLVHAGARTRTYTHRRVRRDDGTNTCGRHNIHLAGTPERRQRGKRDKNTKREAGGATQTEDLLLCSSSTLGGWGGAGATTTTTTTTRQKEGLAPVSRTLRLQRPGLDSISLNWKQLTLAEASL